VTEQRESRLEFLGEGTNVPYETARAVVLPVPLETSVSYGGGTARGPEAILRASAQVETWDERLGREPRDCGIHTLPLDALQDRSDDAASSWIRGRVAKLLQDGKWVVMLGGEHSITPPAVAAAAECFPELEVVQLDAHADLRESYEGNPQSHACAMARSLEHAPVRGIGIRSYSPEEASRIREGILGYRMLPAHEMREEGWIERALKDIDGKPVYLSVDVDYFDPAVVPSTGTPEPGGGAWYPTLDLLEALFRRARVVACDVVELAPIAGLHHPDFTVARLVQKLIGLGAC
jgi:agmatinase